MLDIMSSAKNAIETYNAQLRVNSANIANMSVPGYKDLKVSFQSIYSRVLNGGTSSRDEVGGTNPVQYGSSVGIANMHLDFSQGQIGEGEQLDLAVNGNGLFIVSSDGGNTYRYTRAGKFGIDANGNLVTSTGMQVYGFGPGGGLAPITGLNAYDQTKLSWSNDGNGRLVQYTDSTWTTEAFDTGYKIGLTSFSNLSGLAQSEGNTFIESASSGQAQAFQTPGLSYGITQARSYEQSNVFYTGEIIDSLEAQRAMNGNLTIVKMMNDMISSFINKIS